MYVCNNGGMTRDSTSTPSIQRVDLDTGHTVVLYTEGDGRPLEAPNDLVFDEAGGFWFTDFGGDAIYYATPDGTSISCAVQRVPSPNGIGLAPGGDVLYWYGYLSYNGDPTMAANTPMGTTATFTALADSILVEGA